MRERVLIEGGCQEWGSHFMMPGPVLASNISPYSIQSLSRAVNAGPAAVSLCS